jgi:putative ABC transport system permease protein
VRGEQFKVVGIMEPTLTIPDSSVYMSLSDARRLYLQDFPEAARAAIAAIEPVVDFVVYPTPGTDPEELATRINEAVPGVKASGPSVFKDQITSMTRIFNYILYGVALIALVVGALSVINTMTMSVSERTREIGMRKAIGASDGQIVRQFLGESGIIGLIGGVTGLFLGWVAAVLANKALENSGMSLFLVTPRLAIGSVVFAIFLGIVAGFMPSLHAARMKPVDALRYE